MSEEKLIINSYVTANGGVVILNGPFPIDKAKRVAALCDAAPDLLAALKLFQVRLFMLTGSENVEYMTATAAIAKAEAKS